MENEFSSLGRGDSSGARSFRPARPKLADLLDNITIPDDTTDNDVVDAAVGPLQDDSGRNGSAIDEFRVGEESAEPGQIESAQPGVSVSNPDDIFGRSRSAQSPSETSHWSELKERAGSSLAEQAPFSLPPSTGSLEKDLAEGLSEDLPESLVDGKDTSGANSDSLFSRRFASLPAGKSDSLPAGKPDGQDNRQDVRYGDDAPAEADVAPAAHAFRVNMDKQDKAFSESNGTSNINIKGRADGISIEIGRGNWPELINELSERLRQASGFFRGGKVTLDVGIRPLQENELRQVVSLLEQHSMTLGVIKTTSEQTCQIALANGLAASLDAPEGLQAEPAHSNQDSLQHFVYRGNIRSGQVLQRTETVLVLGDVNPGAQVISHGDILIWGRLRGIVHAGANGDTSAVIAALAMQPTQIRVAQLTAVLPDEKPTRNGRWRGGQESIRRPEIAFASDNQIIVEPWDESKPGGIMAFRR